MAHTCSECTYLDFNKEYNSNDGRFWCEYKLEWHFANEAECYKYCKAYSRSDSVNNSYREYSENCQKSSGCYITTIVCDILNLPDDNEYLNKLRKFRKEKLQNEKYASLLVEYDIIGPIISERIKNDTFNVSLAKLCFSRGIKKVVEYIDNGDDLNAIKLYTEMTKILIKNYNIKAVVQATDVINADISKSGHGVYVKK